MMTINMKICRSKDQDSESEAEDKPVGKGRGRGRGRKRAIDNQVRCPMLTNVFS